MDMINYFQQLSIYNTILAVGETLPEVPESIMFFGIIFIIIGMISILYPQFFWYLRVGRKLEGATPGKLYLWVLRFGGIMVVIVGLVIVYSTGLF